MASLYSIKNDEDRKLLHAPALRRQVNKETIADLTSRLKIL